MKLSDIAQSNFVKILLFGDSGHGKTCFSSTFPTPIEIFDFDNKSSSIAQFYKGKKELLDSIEVKQYGAMKMPDNIKAFQQRLQELAKGFETGAKDMPKTIVLDSFTMFANYLLHSYPMIQTGIKRGPVAEMPVLQDYGLLRIHLGDTVKSLLKLPCNIVVTAHLAIEKDEATGAILREPLVPGKFATELPIYFEEVYLIKVRPDGSRVVQTQSDTQYKLRCQRNLEREIKPSFDAIINNIKA